MIDPMDEPRKSRRRESDLAAEDVLESRSLADELGIDETDFAPDELAPPVDESRLQDFVRRTLPPREREELRQLVASFRPWREAWQRLVSEQPH